MAWRDTDRVTDRVLQRLVRLNPTAVFLAVAVLVLAGFALPGPVGGVILLALALALTALLVRTWSAHGSRARAIRVLILVALVALAVTRFD